MSERQPDNSHALIGNAFLERLENLRLQRECFFTLDLRPLSSEFCRRYTYRGRSMWLDDDSRDYFLTSLQQNNGVFTVENHEQILRRLGDLPEAGTNTGAEKLTKWQSQSAFSSEKPWTSRAASRTKDPSAVHSSAFEFGYFEKRSSARIKHTLPLLLILDDRMIPAETRDISESGLQIRTKVPLKVVKGDNVAIRVSPVTGADAAPGSEALYQIVRATSLLGDTILALKCIEKGTNRTVDYLQQLVAINSSNDKKNKLDLEDALLTSYSLLAERFYMRSSSAIPFFLFEVSKSEGPIRLLFSNPSNQKLLQIFELKDGQHDLSMLADHSFLKLVKTLASRDSKVDILVALHRPSPDEPLAYRFSNLQGPGIEWLRYLADYKETPGFRVFKVVGRPVHRPVPRRVRNDLDKLSAHSTHLAERLLQESDRLIIAGALHDVTAQIQEWSLEAYRSSATAKVAVTKLQYAEVSDKMPEVIPISFVEENRREPRFVSQLVVACKGNNGKFGGRAKDISAHGLSLVCDTPPPVEAGDRLRISFPNIKAGARLLNLSLSTYQDIPFEVIAVDVRTPTTLRLRQIDSWHGRRFVKAFQKYLDKRRDKLPLELSHLVRSSASKYYSSVFIESTATIPVFIFERPNQKPRYAIKAGIAQSPGYLASFFEVAAGEYDFQAFGECSTLTKLLLRLRHQRSVETELMLRKEKIPGTARFRLHIVDWPMSTTASNFVNRAAGDDFCCVKLVVCKPQMPPAPEVEQAISRLENYSETKTEELKSEFTNLVAIGDLVDITGQSRLLQPYPGKND